MNNKFNWQSFISIGLLLSFIIILISGLVLYIAPEGSLSRWIGWVVLSLSKKQWEHIHTVFSYVFILFSIFHIFTINWGLLLSYFVPDKFTFRNYKEFIIALVITILVFTGTLLNINPFKYIINLGRRISDSYAENVELPKVPDAEKLSLEEFSNRVLNVNYDAVESLLKSHQFIEIKKDITVKNFSIINKITPEQLYKILKGELLKESTNSNGYVDFTSYTSFPSEISTIL